MPRCAAASPEFWSLKKWEGTDWDNWLQRPLLRIKHLFAFGHRCPQGLAFLPLFIPFTPLIFFFVPVFRKWREFPKVLFAIKGKGVWRYENTDGTAEYFAGSPHLTHIDTLGGAVPVYLSEIQYWCRAHVALKWPLGWSYHWFLPSRPDCKPFDRPIDDHKMWGGRGGNRRDADGINWFPSWFGPGRTFN